VWVVFCCVDESRRMKGILWNKICIMIVERNNGVV